MTKRTEEEDTSLEVRLKNYKQLHAELAASKGLSVQLAAARTLTEAKKILFGEKRKNRPLRRN